MTNCSDDWIKVSKKNPCPICGKPDWCALAADGTVAKCMREADGSFKQTGDGGSIHRLKERPAEFQPPKRHQPEKPAFPTVIAASLHVAKGLVQQEKLSAVRVPDSSYAYEDRNGQHVASVLRWDTDGGKVIRPVHRQSDGRWAVGQMPRPWLLYRLPDVLAMAEGTVWLVEGEKCADALADIGLPATTSPHGSKSPESADWSSLAGRSVVVWPDRDQPGEEYAQRVCRILQELNPPATVKIVRPDGLPPKGDVADWLELRDGADAETLRAELQALVDAAATEEVTGSEEGECQQIVENPSGKLESASADTEVVEDFTQFPVDLLPEPVRGYARSAAKAIGCDPSMIACPLLVQAAIAIGNSRRIELKRGWVEPPILWLGIVSESGTHKSPALDHGFRALRRFQRLRMKEHAALMEDFRRAEADWKVQSKKTRGAPPDEPIPVRYLVDDATIEGLMWVLQHQPRGVGLVVDELAGWLGGIGRYSASKSQSPDAARWLEMYGGRMVMLDRKSGTPKTIVVNNGSVSVCGGIQPGILKQVLTDEFRLNGLSARLLLVMPPRQARQWREDEVHPEAEREMEALTGRLLEMPLGVNADDGAEPVTVRLSPEAKSAFVDYVNRHGREQLELTGELSAAWSKLEGVAARLALILHSIKAASSGADGTADVSGETMIAGIGLAEWFGNEAKRVYSLHRESPESRELRELADWIRLRGGKTTVRDVIAGNRTYRKRSSDEVRAVLQQLVRAERGQWNLEQTATKPREVFLLIDSACQRITENISGKPNPLTADSEGEWKNTLQPMRLDEETIRMASEW